MRDRYSGRQVVVTAVLLLAVVAVVGVLTAPAAAQDDSERIDVNYTVTADGEISGFEYRYEMNQGTYENFQENAESEGYDDPAVWFAELLVDSSDSYGGYSTAETRRTANGAVMTVVFTDIDVNSIEDTSVSVDDERVSLSTRNIDDPRDNENLTEAYYRYEMPGTIASTNADEVDGRTAIWRPHENYQPTLEVESLGGSSTDDPQTAEGWDVTYDIYVDGDGSIAETRIGLDVDSESYREFQSAADSEGYRTGAEWFANTFVSQNEEFVSVLGTSEEDTVKGTRMVMRFDTDVNAAENVTTTIRNDVVSVRHVEIDAPATQSDVATVTYRYHMPGDIVDSNADRISGRTAVWQLDRNYQSTLTVSSTGANEANSDDGQQQDSAGLDLGFNYTVTGDGNITAGEVSVDVTDSTYQEFQAVTDRQEFDSVSAALADNLVQSETALVGYSNAADVDSEKGTRLTFDVEVNTSASENVTVTAENGSVRVRFANIDDPASDPGVDTVTYRFEMPGEITETNAIETNGTTAIYRLHEEAPSELTVVSSTSNNTGSSGGSSEDDDSFGEVGPGFGVTAAVVAVLAAALLLARRD